MDENAMLMSEVKEKWADFSFDIQVESIYPSNFVFTAQAAAAAGGVGDVFLAYFRLLTTV